MKPDNLSIIHLPSQRSLQPVRKPEPLPLLRILIPAPPTTRSDALAGIRRELHDRDIRAVAERMDRQSVLAGAVDRARQSRTARAATLGMLAVMVAGVILLISFLGQS